MNTILFDYQAFDMQKFGGISRYFANIIEELDLNHELNYKVSLRFNNNYYLKNIKTPLYLQPISSRSKKEKCNLRYSKQCLNKNNFDIFHPTYYNPYFLDYLKKPFILTVHDMIHERLTGYFNQNDPTIGRKKILIEKACKIIAISESTKNDVLYFYPEVEKKIHVVLHGHRSINNQQAPLFNLPERYILFVGSREIYKNFFKLVDAFTHILEIDDSLILLCVGGGNFTRLEQDYLKMKGVYSKTLQMTVNDSELFNIYSNALLFIYPSLYEGFGFPILEAFESHCPILLNDIPPFREVAKDTALYCDATNHLDIADKIRWTLFNSYLTSKKTENGIKRLKLFSLKKSVEETIKVYNSI